MRIHIYSTRPHDQQTLTARLVQAGYQVSSGASRLESATLAESKACDAVCTFVCDEVSRAILHGLREQGVKLILQRAAGTDNIDLAAARELGMAVAHVPEYSPHAVAEHAVALLLSLNRHIHQAYQRMQQANFSLDGLLGFDLHGKTVGVIGMGRIGQCFAGIMQGFGCHVLAYDPAAAPEQHMAGVRYETLEMVWTASDVLSLHCPLRPETYHLVNAELLARTRPRALLINTSRGPVVDTAAVLAALRSEALGGYAADVYEGEACVFFRNCSECGYDDPLLNDLLHEPGVLLTPHQAFFTVEALTSIASTTLDNIIAFSSGQHRVNFLV
ncbi:MAG: 2-hydroxyacid dehydrogenase [Sulfuriferula sp.]